MSKLTDFYRKAEEDKNLRAGLSEVDRWYEAEKPGRDALMRRLISLAGTYGVTLEEADFIEKTGELVEEELESVAGGKSDWWAGSSGPIMWR